MKHWIGLVGASLALALPGLAAAQAGPPAGGTVAIEPRTADGDYDPSLHAFVDGASAALTARGFTILGDPAHAAYLAELTLSHAAVGTGLERDPNAEKVTVGSGVMVPFSTGKSSITTLQRTRLDLRLRSRASGAVVWTGTAVTVRTAGIGNGADGAVATDLMRALLGNYPAEDKDVIGVP